MPGPRASLGVQRPGGRAEIFVQIPEGPGGWRLVKMIAALEYIQIFNLLRPISLISITVLRLSDRPKVFRLDLNDMYNDIQTVQHVQLMQFVE